MTMSHEMFYNDTYRVSTYEHSHTYLEFCGTEYFLTYVIRRQKWDQTHHLVERVPSAGESSKWRNHLYQMGPC